MALAAHIVPTQFNVKSGPLCFNCHLTSQTISTLIEMEVYQTTEYFLPLSLSQMSCCLYVVLHICGRNDEQCLQKMGFLE